MWGTEWWWCVAHVGSNIVYVYKIYEYIYIYVEYGYKLKNIS